MATIGESISRLRTMIKSVKQDASLSDRFLYSLILKHGKLLMRRQDNLNRIMKFNSIFKTLNFVDLEDVDKVKANCYGVSSGCTFKRTKVKLPKIIEGYWGVLIREVTSIDGSIEIKHTYPTLFEKISRGKTYKYNKTKYFWYLDGYLYFPNIEWDAVSVTAVFEGDVNSFNCEDTDISCLSIQDTEVPIPEFLFSEIEELVKRDLTTMLQVPVDTQQDKQNIMN